MIRAALILLALLSTAAQANDRTERCTDLAAVYQLAASLRDTDMPAEKIAVHLRMFQRTTAIERQAAIDYVMQSRYLSASTAFNYALVQCKAGSK